MTTPPPDFYATYGQYKGYATPTLKAKHVAEYDRSFWTPSGCRNDMSVLEIGCGTGLFLSYLAAKGVRDFLGIDHDPALAPVVPEPVRDRFRAADVWAFLDGEGRDRRFDRIALFDVLEHFPAAEGTRLLGRLGERLAPDGRIVVRVPNAGSPFGLHYQNGDLTHCCAFTPGSLRQMAIAAGLVCTACLGEDKGSRRRRITQRLLFGVLSWMLAAPCEIWSPNLIGVIGQRQGD